MYVPSFFYSSQPASASSATLSASPRISLRLTSVYQVKFCLDLRTHSSEGLAYPKLGPFQGAALLVYNSGVFAESDFKSIQNIGDSEKKKQITSTGRFGIGKETLPSTLSVFALSFALALTLFAALFRPPPSSSSSSSPGFNSTYHVTDIPSFVSGTKLVYFDPHVKHLPRMSAANPGKIIDFMHPKGQEMVASFPAQFEPYMAFGNTFKKAFNGTLFRLPLRTLPQAAVSRICSVDYSVSHARGLVLGFKEEVRRRASPSLALPTIHNIPPPSMCLRCPDAPPHAIDRYML